EGGKSWLEGELGVRLCKWEKDPRELAVTDKEIGTAAEKLVRDAGVVEKLNKCRNRIVIADEEQVGRPANSERSAFGQGDAGVMLDTELRDRCEKFGILKTHGAWGAPFQAKPSVRCWRGLRFPHQW